MTIDFATIIPNFDAILSRGLCSGIGTQKGQMCIEAAITQAMGLPFSDQPNCVTPAVRRYKITLNDRRWTSAEARAKGLRDLGIAQIGSAGVVDGIEFTKRLAEQTIRRLIPAVFREVFAHKSELLAAADRCEQEGTAESAREAERLASAAAYAAADAAAEAAANAAAYAAAAAAANAVAAEAAAYAAAYAAAAAAANAAANAATAHTDKYLLLSASLALEVLRELKSPGCEWIDWRPE